jgi:hypothetical protein
MQSYPATDRASIMTKMAQKLKDDRLRKKSAAAAILQPPLPEMETTASEEDM